VENMVVPKDAQAWTALNIPAPHSLSAERFISRFAQSARDNPDFLLHSQRTDNLARG
jgi:hypothetical protein